MSRWIAPLVVMAALLSAAPAPGRAQDIYSTDNLAAWCIVPYDAAKRTPEQRAQMLDRIGLRRLAYDWRPEHVPTFDAEVEAMKRHRVEVVAWWFPTVINNDARAILGVIQRHGIHPQLWVNCTDPLPKSDDQQAKVNAAVERLRPIVAEAAKVGCKVGLYNHGGWGGEPENQLAIIAALNLPGGVGMVYNFHHAHEHIDRFAAFWPKIKGHVLAVTLNGMNKGARGGKIMTVGEGEHEAAMMRVIRDSGWRGMVSVLNHRTDVDAEVGLTQNMAGVERLRQQLTGARSAAPAFPAPLTVAGREEYRTPPITVELRATVRSSNRFNILIANEDKRSPTHWELFAMKGTGALTAYLPGYTPDHVRTDVVIADGAPHDVAMVFEPARVRLYVDGRPVADTKVKPTGRGETRYALELAIGSLVDGTNTCDGTIEAVRLSRGVRVIDAHAPAKLEHDAQTIDLWAFGLAGGAKANDGRLPGLVMQTGGAARLVRTASRAPGEAAGETQWTGYINVTERDRYRFNAGGAELTINGRAVKADEAVVLNRGANALAMRAGSGAAVRLMWSSAEFPWEPAPATAFSHDAPAGEVARKLLIHDGRTLMGELRCIRCHTPPAEVVAPGGMPELTALDAPMLLDAGLRLNPAWVERWVENPHAMRPGATMPATIQPGEGKHVAAFLDTLAFGEAPAKAAADDAAVKRGGELYAQLGCVGCHTVDKQPRVAGRMSLRHAAWKYKPGALADYLASPAKRYIWTRMPDFKLSGDEAAALAAFLEANGDPAATSGGGGVAEMGGKIIARAGCVACHPMTVGNELKAPALAAIRDWQRGCMAADDSARGGAPGFGFTPRQREALSQFGRAGVTALARDSAADFAQRQVARLNCAACHQRDGVTDAWTLATAEVGRLLPGAEVKKPAADPKEKKPKKPEPAEPEVDQTRPSLTFAGEKLRVGFMRQIIGGELAYKPRPWMAARMPSFGVYATRLADGLAAEHGVGPEDELPKLPGAAMVEAGRQLVTKQKGFGCNDCHAMGEQPAMAVFEAEGVNLAYAAQRLRPDYYRRWLHNPTRIDPATKMPRYADPDGTTPLTEIGAGDAAWQFEAIRQYTATLAQPKAAALAQRGNAPTDYTKMTDANWMDERPSKVMAAGRVVASTVRLPKERPVYKALTMRVGDHGEATVCFDTATLKWRAAWTGGFLDLGDRRFGLTEIPTPHGQIAWITPGPGSGWAQDGKFDDPRKSEYEVLPHDWGRFLGYYLHGDRVVLRYTVGGVEVLESPWVQARDGTLVITRHIEVGPSTKEMKLSAAGDKVVTIPPHDQPVRLVIDDRGESTPGSTPLRQWVTGGSSRLGAPLVTRGVVGKTSGGPFQIDTLTIPYDNPDGALFFAGGHDFFDDGQAALCTAHGDVWLISGIDDRLEKLTWKRFAAGLYQPLGLKIVDGKVFVICRDGLVRLHDVNGDGEADYYERFNNDLQVTASGHSFANCLETDAEGNFYFVKCSDPGDHAGCVLKVSRDGRKLEVVATGLRNPNGMGMAPGNVLTSGDQQGTWVPETRVDIIKPGGFYGFVPHAHRTPAPTSYDGPLCWVPRALDNSAGGQVWVPPGSWGALGGQMLHLSYGRCSMMVVLRDTVDGVEQGATAPLPGRFLSGVMRGRFNPRDGHLYLSGLNGWQTAAVRDGCFQRVRYTGKPLDVPVGWAVKKDAIELTFAREMDAALAADVENYSAEQWNYLWSDRYGSKDWSVADPKREGRDPVTITAAKLLDDGRTVRLELPGLKPVMQMKLTYNLDATDGAVVKGAIYPTINRVPGGE